MLVKIPQQLTLQSEFLMLRKFFFLLRMIVHSSSWRISHVNFSRQAGNLCSNLVASSKILVAMVIKMVATWRVVWGRNAIELANQSMSYIGFKHKPSDNAIFISITSI